MSLFYRMAYRLGVTPWEHAATHPAAARHITALFEREERERQAPYGRALDLGCGSGHWSIVLAERGWDVTGIDVVPNAIDRARARAEAAASRARFICGDAMQLAAAGVGTGFRLVWDFGAIHGFTAPQRQAVARGLDAVTAPDASMLLVAWMPGRRGPLPRGMSRHDIESDFPTWRIAGEEPFDATGLPGPLRGVDPRIYRLRRRLAAS